MGGRVWRKSGFRCKKGVNSMSYRIRLGKSLGADFLLAKLEPRCEDRRCGVVTVTVLGLTGAAAAGREEEVSVSLREEESTDTIELEEGGTFVVVVVGFGGELFASSSLVVEDRRR